MKECLILATLVLIAIGTASAIGRREENAELEARAAELEEELGQFGHWDHYRDIQP